MEPVRPDYSGGCVTGLVPALLGGRETAWMPPPVRGARSVVLFVADGLGWDALQSHAAVMPTLSACTGGPITTVAPSTTAAALTSITTGLAPARHGITGFRMRVDGAVLNVLRWQLENGKRPPEPVAVQRSDPFLGRVVPVITKSEFRTSGFTAAHLRGGDFLGWPTPSALVERCRAAVERGERFLYVYYAGVDEIAHHFGLHDAFYPAELAAVDRLVGALLEAFPDDTALVVTADHGQVHVGADGWIGLGRLDAMVAAYAGDARFRSLHAQPGRADDLFKAALDHHRAEAWVFTREELLDDGWLGPDPLSAVRGRVGDVVLAAKDRFAFVDPTLPRETGLVSAHGSLTAAEMWVPCVAARGRA